ncbi:MAG: PKD domain-containing protein [Flavobacteriales bacterium]|nr:PKD domain-containing protein [Flavobacteriales bacterium]
MIKKITSILAISAIVLVGAAQSSLKFDGTANGQLLPDSTALSFSNLTGLSFTVWVKTNWAGNGYVFEFADSAGYAAGNTGFRFAMLDRRAGGFPPSSELAFETVFDNYTVRASTNMNNVPSDEWVHLAGVISRDALNGNTATYVLELFVNGNSVATSNAINVNNANPAIRNLHLSKNSRSRIGNIIVPPRFGSNRFTGNMDDILIYDKALSATEIKDMVCSRTYPSSGKLLYYNCNDGSGTIAYDIGSSGANGTLESGVSWDDVDFVSSSVANPVADFTYSTTSPSLSVDFTDNSSPAVSRKWEFGNGDTSAALNPTYTYKKQGTYQVSLTTTDVCGKISSKKTQSVVVSCPPAKSSFISSASNRKVDFEANKAGILNFIWDFGDGSPLDSGATKEKTSHIYAAYGTYNACLYVMSACGLDTLCEELNLAAAGLGETSNNANWSVFPNPASNVLNVVSSVEFQDSRFVVKDLQGRNVASQSVLSGSKIEIDIEDLKPGFYTIEVVSRDQSNSLKFIKE